MTQALVTTAQAPLSEKLEQVLIAGDLKSLSTEERVDYYNRVCSSVGLNPLTRPFEYLQLNGRLLLYARKDATDQLRQLHRVSVHDMTMQILNEVYVVRACFTDSTGRTDEATGAVPIANLKGEALANAYMKAETKCKRRGTLSICGLGMLDETEVDSIPGAKVGEPEAKPGFGAAPRKPAALPDPNAEVTEADDEQAPKPSGFGQAPRKAPQAEDLSGKLSASTVGVQAAKQDSSSSPAPAGSISTAQLRRVYGLLHEAMGREGVDKEGEPERYAAVEEQAKRALHIWLKRETKNEHLSHCPWSRYEDLCEQIPKAVSFALQVKK